MASFQKKLFLTLRCARVSLWPAICLNAGIVAFFTTSASLPQAALIALSLCCVASYGFLINDYKDVEVDRINKSSRLENAGAEELKFIRFSFLLSLAASLIFSAFLGMKGIGFVGLISLGLTVYTLYARKKLVFATILAACLSSTPLWVPSIVFNSHLTVFQMGLIGIILLLLMGREILFDVADMLGDFRGKRRTFATVFNQKFAINISIALNVSGAIFLCLLLLLDKKTASSFIMWSGVILFAWLILPPILRLKNNPQSQRELELFTQRSRLAMLLLPVFWLNF